MNNTSITPEAIKAAQAQLDAHLKEIIQWHFNPETGCPYWLDWAKKNFDPRKEINSFADVLKFPHFADESLRDLQPEETRCGELQQIQLPDRMFDFLRGHAQADRLQGLP